MYRLLESVRRSFNPSPSKIDDSGLLKLKIISKLGGAVLELRNTNFSNEVIEAFLLEMARIGNFPAIPITNSVIIRYQLVRVKDKKKLRNDASLSEQKIESREEFLLVSQRRGIYDPMEHENLAGPSILTVFERTRHVLESGSSKRPFQITMLMLTDDMRKVFVTLAHEAAYVVGVSKVAEGIIEYYRHRILNFIKHEKNIEKVLMKLGFDEERVNKAMLMSGGIGKVALQWLIDHDVTYDDEGLTTLPPSRRGSGSPRTSLITSDRKDSILSSKYKGAGTVKKRVEGLLEIVNFYSEKPELVYAENIDFMNFLGFNTDDAINALSMTRNSVAAAIAYIHGETSPSITELRDGLPPDSEIREIITDSPQTLGGIAKPEIFMFLICVLDNPAFASGWNPFSDTGILMTHIISTYHERKHVLAINQFNDSRLPISALSAPSMNID